MNVALRAVHDALRTTGHPDRRWHALVEALRECAGVTGVVGPQQLAGALRVAGIRGGSSAEWISNLRLLGVISPADHVDAGRADIVESALGMVADSFDPVQTAESWWPVATLPPQLHAMLHPPPMRQTAGVLLELMDAAHSEIIIATPFVDDRAVDFLSESLVAAGRRGVAVRVVTSSGQAIPFVAVAKTWPSDAPGTLRVTEIVTDLSPLGSHAKVFVADREHGYVGSANITGAGLGRHVEIGVELSGAQIGEFVRVLIALERAGTRVLMAGPDRR